MGKGLSITDDDLIDSCCSDMSATEYGRWVKQVRLRCTLANILIATILPSTYDLCTVIEALLLRSGRRGLRSERDEWEVQPQARFVAV